jgi:hypothetical protein
VKVWTASSNASGNTDGSAVICSCARLKLPLVTKLAPSRSIRAAISGPVIVPVPSRSMSAVRSARPDFSAGSSMAPASAMSRAVTIGSVCCSTTATRTPLGSVVVRTAGMR